MMAIFEYADGDAYSVCYPSKPRGIYKSNKEGRERPYKVTFINRQQILSKEEEEWIRVCKFALKTYDNSTPICSCKNPIHSNSNVFLCYHCGGELYTSTKKDVVLVDDMSESPVSEETQQTIVNLMTLKAKSDKVNTGLSLIPFHSLFALGKIFVEGLRYGKDNWKKGVGDKEYQEERLEHALTHLALWKEGDRSEAHLAKVAWFCFTQLELERIETIQSLNTKIDAQAAWDATSPKAPITRLDTGETFQ